MLTLAGRLGCDLARVRIRPLTENVVLVDQPIAAVERATSAVVVVRQASGGQGAPQQL